MFWTNTKRIVRTGFFNFWRNSTVSLASVLVMLVTLLVIGFLIFGSAILKTSLNELRNKVDVNVTLIGNADEQNILTLKHSLENLPSVSMVTYVSKEDALSAFKARHANDQSILDALDELKDNPLGATLNVKAKNPSEYQAIADFLQSKNTIGTDSNSIIDHINYNQNKTAIDKLSKIIDASNKLGLAIILMFVIISVLIAFNTIRLTIYIVKDEINVMRLIGAASSYIQGPFMVVGVIYGLVAAVIALLMFLPITYWIGRVTEDFFIGMNIFSYYIHQFPQIFIIIVLSGVIIGAVSSLLAIRRYLKI